MNPKKFRGWCLNGCGNEIKVNAERYCSFRCQHAHRYKIRVTEFVGQGGLYGYVTPKFLARLLRELYGERCAKCGWSKRHEMTGKVPVEIEHIDGDWRNNRLANLILLCPNCHSLTATFRGLNRGRGRAHRLGGRENPLKSPQRRASSIVTVPAQKGFELPSMQLRLL